MPGLEKDLLKLFLEAVFHICPEIPNSELLINELCENALFWSDINKVEFHLDEVTDYDFNVFAHAFLHFFEKDKKNLVMVDMNLITHMNWIIVRFSPEAKNVLKEANNGSHLMHIFD